MSTVSIEHRLIADTQTHRHGVAVKTVLAWRLTACSREFVQTKEHFFLKPKNHDTAGIYELGGRQHYRSL